MSFQLLKPLVVPFGINRWDCQGAALEVDKHTSGELKGEFVIRKGAHIPSGELSEQQVVVFGKLGFTFVNVHQSQLLAEYEQYEQKANDGTVVRYSGLMVWFDNGQKIHAGNLANWRINGHKEPGMLSDPTTPGRTIGGNDPSEPTKGQ